MLTYLSIGLEVHYFLITLRSLIKGGWPCLHLMVNTSWMNLKVAFVDCSMDEVLIGPISCPLIPWSSMFWTVIGI